MKLPNCPHCGQMSSYTDAFVVKNKTYYKCHNCGKKLSIGIKSALYKLFVFAQIIAISVFAIAIVLPSVWCRFGLFVVFLIFIGFYLFSPFLIRFEKMVGEKYASNEYANNYKTSNKNGFDLGNDIYSN